MPSLTTKTFSDLRSGMATAVQARASGLVDLSVGSILLAAVEAVAGVVIWLQGLILALLALTRASSSTGADLDSWVADFGAAYPGVPENTFARLGAVPATGLATFSRLTPTGVVYVPVGAQVETADGSLKFTVVADLTNGAYDAANSRYPMANGISSVAATVQGSSVGVTGNVQPGQIAVISSPITGVDAVTNVAAFTNGQDAESDASLRLRFRAFILSLREATPSALIYNIGKVRAGLSVMLRENVEQNGAPRKGFVFAVIDDGSGNPADSVTSAAVIAMDQHRAAGIEVAVYEPVIVLASVAATVVAGGSNPSKARADVAAALTTFLNSRPIGETVRMSRLYQVIYDASPDISSVTTLTLNGVFADLTISANLGQVAKAGTITVT